MRILIIGFIVFVGWASLSTYIYVCKIKGLCSEPQTTTVVAVNQNNAMASEPIETDKTEEEPEKNKVEKAKIPQDLVIYFAFDKSELIIGNEASKYFEESTAYLNQNSKAKLTVIGHTDVIGSAGYNHALGLRRAKALQMYFENKGMPASRIKVESKGEEDPADDNCTDEGRANNRRTVVTLKQ